MAEVAYPSKRTFWKATGTGVVHEGFTDIDQVTSTGQPMLESDTDASTIYPPLPTSGWMEESVVYSYNRGMVIVRQPHERTIYAPEDTPALFYVYRANTEGAGWVANEPVEKGDTRTFEGKTYQCIQPHTTQVDYTPTATLGVLWKEVPQQSDEYAVFVHPTGAHDVYMKGDIVWYPTLNSTLYRSKIDNNSWSPDEYANGWEIYVP